MKKLLLICAMATCGLSQAYAQLDEDDFGFFNHVSAGISLGTDGIGIEVAAPLTYNFAVRAGYNFMPKLKYSKNIDLKNNDGTVPGAFLTPEAELEGKLNMGDFKLLVDWYPFRKSSFHATAGFYIGGSKLVDVYNKEPFMNADYYGKAGINLGDENFTYSLYPENDGNVKAELKVNSFKPYLGVGFGRAVPKGRIGVQFDLGVQFWGAPEVWGNMHYQTSEGTVTRYEKIHQNWILNQKKDYQDLKDAIKTIEKIRVYPVLNIRVNGRIF